MDKLLNQGSTALSTNCTIFQKLQKIQYELKAPKNLYNSFGRYNYRNAESILEAFKPYGEKYCCALVVSDSIEAVGDRTYVKATATLFDTETGASISSYAYAREALAKKGMDDSQLTGATSSYARKYCLNGLFLLDDTKDSDTDEFAKLGTSKEAASQPVTPATLPIRDQNAARAQETKQQETKSYAPSSAYWGSSLEPPADFIEKRTEQMKEQEAAKAAQQDRKPQSRWVSVKKYDQEV